LERARERERQRKKESEKEEEGGRVRGQDHRIAGPQDGISATYSMNPNNMCPRRKTI